MKESILDRLRSSISRLKLYLRKRYPKAYGNLATFSNKSERVVEHLSSKKWFRYGALTLGSLFIIFSIFFFSIYLGLWGKVPTKNELANLNQSLASQLLDRNGDVIGKYYVYDRRPVAYEEFPPHLIGALIATEDYRFYEHDGIDKRSLLRVFFKTILMQDDSAGGGSTITQQLAKNLFGRNNEGKLGLVVSKFKEFIIAQRLEEVYTKEEIINLYLNTVPFPDYTFGIESASQKFFDKPTHDLTLNESATLVGTLKANHSYNPRLFPDRAKERRNIVLGQMLKYGYLEPKDTIGIERDTITLNYREYNEQGIAPYFREHIRREVQELLKDYKKADGSPYDLYRDGLTVQTTLDKKMQLMAEESMREHMKAIQNAYVKAYGKYAPWKRNSILDPSLKKLPIYSRLEAQGMNEKQIKDSLSKTQMRSIFDWNKEERETEISVIDSLSHYLSLLNCGFVSIDPHTGAVMSYVGGIDFGNFKFDHVSQSKRMVGSTFKPFLYTAALENGMDPCRTYTSESENYIVDGKYWSPTNSNGTDDRFTTYSLKGALAHSVNTVAVKLLLDLGLDKVIDQAKDMGIDSDLPRVPSLALGTAEIHMMDLAGAYTPFVNDGKPVKPYYISQILNSSGEVIASFEPEISDKKAISDFTRQAMVEMMRGTVREGTATRLRYTYQIRNDVAGKTGTTQDNKDAWFVGLTPNMIAVTWVGNDDYRIGFSNTSIGSGANAALPIFAKYMQRLNADSTYAEITQARFDNPSGRVWEALDCPSVEKDSTSVRYLLSTVFGQRDKEDLDPVRISENGRRLDPIRNTDTEETEDDGEKEEERKGFFSFLKRKKKNDDG